MAPDLMTPYVLVFLAGLAGSMHCAGMCGGIACLLREDPRGRAVSLLRHLVYNLGRASSYCFIGALVGHLGVLLAGHAGESGWAAMAQRLLALLSGMLMIYIGLQFVAPYRKALRGAPGWIGDRLGQGLRQLIGSPALGAPLALGVLNGFLPCPLVYAFAAQAAASGGALSGLLLMAAFALGTFPAMLLIGVLGQRLWPRRAPAGTTPIHTGPLDGGAGPLHANWRLNGARIAGGFIVVLGLITCARGLLPMSAHLHGP